MGADASDDGHAPTGTPISIDDTLAPDAAKVVAAGLPSTDPTHYIIQGELGRGGMGRIAIALDRRLDRVVALKLLANPHKTLRARFEREARITARLMHP